MTKIYEDENQETVHEPLFRGIIHNDNVTPMGFVVQVLTSIFKLLQVDAVKVMLTDHNRGEAVVQILPKSEAEKHINKSHFAAVLEGYHLHFSLEAE